MELSDTVLLSIITVISVLITGTISPMLLAYQINKNRHLERQEDYARQDAVADKLLASNNKIAKVAAESTKIAIEKIDVIHTLVNSTLTAAKQSQLDAHIRLLTALLEKQIHNPTIALSILIAETEKIIFDLKAELSNRAEQNQVAEAQVAEAQVAEAKSKH